jgi:virulence-associated protein VapD
VPKEIRRRYAINFDLSIKQLETFYDPKTPKKAYKEIRSYMLKHGFSHRQWSGYISNGTMTKSELIDFTTDLHQNFPWLINCEGSMDATVITDIFDIKQMILDSLDVEDEDVSI